MISPSKFHDLVSGRRKGIRAAMWRGVLRAAEAPYTAAVRWRNHRFDADHARSLRVNVPVISVGNITLGGTGKTPLVKWIAHWLRDRGLRVALVSRGYGVEPGARNDEALELEQALPDVPHLQNPDRVAAARVAIEELASQVILLDDGFQHRRLARDLDIVLLDAWEPFGFGHVFPRGTLREPISSLRRAQVICLTRADQVDADRRNAVRERARQVAPEAVWCEAVHAPRSLLAANGRSEPIEELRGKRIAAFCGIGNPSAFRRTLEGLGCEVVTWREFPDHHQYTAADVENLSNWATRETVDMVVCTHKDLVKLQIDAAGNRQLRALVVELAICTGQLSLQNVLSRIVAGVPAAETWTGG